MTTDLEKQFYTTFGIEKKKHAFLFKEPDGNMYYYPQITDRIYLMLLATLTCISNTEFPFANIQKLKEDILEEVIKHQYGFDKHQVQALFSERGD